MDNDFSMTSPSSPLPPSPFMLPPSPDIFSLAITEQDQSSSSSLSSSLSTHQSSFKFPLPPRPSLSSVVKKRKHTPVTTSVSESSSPPPLSSASLSSSSSSSSSLNLSSSLPLFEIEPLSPPSPSQSAPSSSLFALESLPSPLLHPSLSLFAPETISFSNPSSSSSCPSLSSSPQNQQTTSFYTHAFSSFIASPLFSPSFSLTHSPVFSPLSPPPPPRTTTPATSSESTFLPQFVSSSSSSSSPEDESILLITECLQNQKAVPPFSSNIATITPTINRIVTKATTTGELISPTQDFETSFSENCLTNVTTTTSTITASLNANTTDQTAANDIFNSRAKKYRILRKQKLFRKGREKKSAFAAIFTHQYPHQMDSIGQDVQMTPEIGSSVDAALDRRQDLLPTEIEQISSSILAPQSSQNLPFLASQSNFTSNAETPSSLPIEILSNLLPQTSNNDILVALKQRQLILKMQQQLKTAECLKKATQDQMEALQIKTTSNPLPVLTTPMFSNPEEVSSLNNFLNNFLSTAIDVGKCDTRFLSLLTETLSKTLTNKPENSNKVPSSSTVQIDNSFQHQNIVRSNFQTEDNLISPVFQSPFFTNSSHLQPKSKTCSTTSCITSPNIVSSIHSVATSTQQKSSIKNQSKVHLSNNPLIITTSHNHLNNKPIFTFTDSTSSTNISTPQIPATEMKVSSQPCITSSSSSVFSTGQKPIFRIVSGYKNTKNLKRLKRNRNQGRSKKTSIENPTSTVKTIDTNVITTNVSASKNLKSSAVVNQNNIFIPNLPNMAGISSVSPMVLPQQTNMNRNNISKGFDNNYLNMNNTISTAKNSAKILRNEIGYQSNPSHTKSSALIESENVQHSFLNTKSTNYQLEQQTQLLNERSDLSTAFGALNYLPNATNPQKQPKVAQISGKKVKLPLARSLSDITESIRMKLLTQNGLISNNVIDNTLLSNGLNEILQRQDVNLNQQILQKNQLYSDLNTINLYPGEIVPRYDRKLFKRISTTKENVKIIQQQDAGLTALMTDILNENLSAINKHPTKNSEILNYITSILNIFGSNRPNEMVSACDLAVNQPLLFLKIYQQLAAELSLSNSQNVCKQNQKTPLTKNNSLGNNCSNSNVKSKILRLPKKETKKETLVYGTKILRMSLSSYPLTAPTSVLTTSQSAQPKASPIFIPNQIPVFSQILPPTFSSPTKTIHQFRPENPPPSPPSPKQNELYTRPNDPNEVIPPNVVLTTSSLTGGRLDEIVRTSFTSSVCGRPSIAIPNLYMKNKSKSSLKRTPELTQSTQSLPFETQQFLNFSEATPVNVIDTIHSSPPVSSVLQNNWSQISETSSFHSDPTIFLSISSTMPNVETLSSNSYLADPHLTISSTQHNTLSTKVVQIDNALSFKPYNSRRNLVSDKNMFENETFQTSNLSDIQLTANDYLIRLQNEKTSKLMELISLQEKLIETSKLTEIKCELLKKETMEANERLMKSRQLALSSGPNQENAHQSQNVHNDHQVMNLITQNNTQSPSKSSSSINCSSSILQTNVFSQNCLQDQNTFSSNLKNEENLNDELENKRNEQSSKNIFYKNSKDCFLFSDQQTIYNKSCKESDKDYEISDTRSINILSSFGGFPHVDEEFMNSEYQNTCSNSPMDHQQLNRQLHQIFPDLYHFDSPQNDLLDLKRTEDFDVETRKNDISFNTSGNNQTENNEEIKTKPRQQKVDNNNKTMKLIISNHSSSQPNQTKQGITCETEFKEKLAELLDYVQNCSSNSRVESNNMDKRSNNELSFLNRSSMNINENHQTVNLPNSELGDGDSDVDELLDFISKSNHASNENTSMEMDDYASFLSSAHFSVSSAAESTICLESPLNYDRFNLPLTGDITFCQSNSDNSSSGIGSVQSCFNRIDQTPLCMDVSYDQELGMDGLTPDQNISENHSEFDFSSVSPWFKSSNNSLNPSQQHNDYQTTSNKLHQNDFNKPMSIIMSSQSIQCPIDSSTSSSSSSLSSSSSSLSSSSSSSSSTATTSSSSSSYHHLELTPISPDEFPRRDIDKYHIDERRFTFGSDIGSSSLNTFGDDSDFVIREFFDQSMML